MINQGTGKVDSGDNLLHDSTLRVWDLTNKTSRVLNGHTDAVYRILKLNKSMIVSSSGKTWRLWDLTKTFNPEDVENLDENVVRLTMR